MRRSFLPLTLALAASLAALATHASSQQSSSPVAQAQQEQASSSPQNPAPAQQPPTPVQTPAPEPLRYGPIIVLDPAHGGTDTGARGANGLTEKEQVLILARMVRSDLERQGFHVLMTRNDDSNPSYEDRSAIANAYRDAIFISLHVSSTGKFGTARSYSYQFSTPLAPADDDANPSAAHPGNGLIVWEEAQKSHLDASKRLADLVQLQLVQRFSGSPQTSAQYAIRDLRSVNAPAIAIEISSVVVTDPNALLALGAPLAGAVTRSLAQFRPAQTPAPAGGQP